MAKNTEVAVAAQTALSAELAGFEQFAGAGTENLTTSDILIPRLGVLQALSPQVQKKKAEYIEGAEVGHIADLGTGDLFKDGVLFLPVYYRKQWLEWAPRASGKGLVAMHDTDAILAECVRDDKNRPITAEGNLISETAQWYGLNLSASRRKCFIPMAASQLKRSRKWMTMITSERIARPDGTDFAAPIFYRAYMLTTADESNEQGDWSVWSINRDKALPEMAGNWQAIMEEAVKFREALIAGEARADLNSMDAEEGTVNGAGRSAGGNEGAM